MCRIHILTICRNTSRIHTLTICRNICRIHILTICRIHTLTTCHHIYVVSIHWLYVVSLYWLYVVIYVVSIHWLPSLTRVRFFMCISTMTCSCTWQVVSIYWLSISRLLKIIGLFCKRALQKRLYSTKETYNFKEPSIRSHPHSALYECIVWGGYDL